MSSQINNTKHAAWSSAEAIQAVVGESPQATRAYGPPQLLGPGLLLWPPVPTDVPVRAQVVTKPTPTGSVHAPVSAPAAPPPAVTPQAVIPQPDNKPPPITCGRRPDPAPRVVPWPVELGPAPPPWPGTPAAPAPSPVAPAEIKDKVAPLVEFTEEETAESGGLKVTTSDEPARAHGGAAMVPKPLDGPDQDLKVLAAVVAAPARELPGPDPAVDQGDQDKALLPGQRPPEHPPEATTSTTHNALLANTPKPVTMRGPATPTPVEVGAEAAAVPLAPSLPARVPKPVVAPPSITPPALAAEPPVVTGVGEHEEVLVTHAELLDRYGRSCRPDLWTLLAKRAGCVERPDGSWPTSAEVSRLLREANETIDRAVAAGVLAEQADHDGATVLRVIEEV